MMKKNFTILITLLFGMFINAQIVINEIFSAGGNSGAIYKQDFIELYNRGTSPVTLTNAYLQYGGATSSMTIYTLPASIILAPGQYYLIQGTTGSNGTVNLISPDAIISSLNMAANAGKVALTSDNIAVTISSQSNIIDLVGWGNTVSLYEGGVAPAPSVTSSISRSNGTDTNNNTSDFSTGTPSPTNSANQVTLGINENFKSKTDLVKNILVSDVLEFCVKTEIKIINMNGQVLKTAIVDNGTSVDVSSFPKGNYIITAKLNGANVSQKIIKK